MELGLELAWGGLEGGGHSRPPAFDPGVRGQESEGPDLAPATKPRRSALRATQPPKATEKSLRRAL